jgi:hypothetical protein
VSKIIEGPPGQPPSVLIHFDGFSLLMLILLSLLLSFVRISGTIQLFMILGWSEKFDYTASIDDPDLHPPGYCALTKHKLEIPRNYASVFSWSTYLEENMVMAVCFRACRSTSSFFNFPLLSLKVHHAIYGLI